MGLQLIFAVEANKQCKSDWIYVKDTIDYFYQYDQAHVKFSAVYMGGKGNYNKPAVEREISRLISQYSISSRTSRSQIIYCFDCDNYDTKREDRDFLNRVQNFCEEKGYDFVWFCKNIEGAYLEREVGNNRKGAEAADFKRKLLVNLDYLFRSSYMSV